MRRRCGSSRWSAALAALVVLVALGGCGARPGRAAAPSPGDGVLALVPADTPYFFASLGSPPAGWLERAGAQLEPLLQPLVAIIDGGGSSRDPEAVTRWLRALREEWRGKALAAALADLGLEARTPVVSYGIGLWPVLRYRPAAPERVRAFVARVEARAGIAAPTASWQGIPHWRVPLVDRLALVAAIHGPDVVVTLSHPAVDAEVLPLVLGDARPARSLAGSPVLRALRARAPGATQLGRVDLLALGRAATLQGDDLATRQWRALMPPVLDAGCRPALVRVLEHAPSVWLATRPGAADTVESSMGLEVSESTGRAIADLAAPVPGLALDAPERPLLAVGLGMDLGAGLRAFEAWLRWQAGLAGCPTMAASGRDVLAELVGVRDQLLRFVADLRGFYAVLDDVGEGRGGAPQLHGFLVVAHAHPETLLQIADLLAPRLGLGRLVPGQVLSIPTGLPLVGTVQVTRNRDAVAAWVGDAGTHARAALAARPARNAPMLVFAHDGVRAAAIAERWPALAPLTLATDDEDEAAEVAPAPPPWEDPRLQPGIDAPLSRPTAPAPRQDDDAENADGGASRSPGGVVGGVVGGEIGGEGAGEPGGVVGGVVGGEIGGRVASVPRPRAPRPPPSPPAFRVIEIRAGTDGLRVDYRQRQ